MVVRERRGASRACKRVASRRRAVYVRQILQPSRHAHLERPTTVTHPSLRRAHLALSHTLILAEPPPTTLLHHPNDTPNLRIRALYGRLLFRSLTQSRPRLAMPTLAPPRPAATAHHKAPPRGIPTSIPALRRSLVAILFPTDPTVDPRSTEIYRHPF